MSQGSGENSNKRNRSSVGEENEHKRDRKDIQSEDSGEEELSSNSETSVFHDPMAEMATENQDLPSGSKPDEFTICMLRALANPKVYELINGKAMELMEKIDKRVTGLEEKTTKLEEKSDKTAEKCDQVMSEVEVLKRKIDDFEQRDRANQVILASEEKIGSNTEEVTKYINDQMEANLSAEEVAYVVDLKAKEGTRLRIVFKSPQTKYRVMKKKPKLKNKKVWVSDDLTARRSGLAFLARKAVKEEKIHSTWAWEGKVFFKSKANSAAKRLTDAAQLPK